MEYQSQMCKFLLLTSEIKISSHAQVLYLHILENFINKGCPPEAKIDNGILRMKTQLSKNQFFSARKELETLCLITYTAGGGSAGGTYTISDLKNISFQDLLLNAQKIKQRQKNEAEIDKIKDLKENFKYFSEEDQVWANYIVRVLKQAISNNTGAVLSGTYRNVLDFIDRQNNLDIGFIIKLITTLKRKKDITDKPAYILACIVNYNGENVDNAYFDRQANSQVAVG